MKKVWYYVRMNLTKAVGVIGIVVGYALQTQAQWVNWLSEKPRGVATKYLGVAVFILGLYNHLFPPTRPIAPTDEET